MQKIRYSIKYTLHRRKRADGTFTIRLSVTWLGRRIVHYLPVGVAEDQWDSVNMLAKVSSQHKENVSVNKVIINLNDRLNDLFDSAAVNDRIPSEKEVMDIIENKDPVEEAKKEEKHPLPDLLQKFTITQSTERGWVPLTARKFAILNRELKSAGLKYIEEMDSDGVQRYLKWITDRKYENAVAMKKVSILRWFLGWCKKEGYLKNDDYMSRGLHLKCPQKVVIYLEWEELLQLYHFDYGEHYALSNARDVFCFCAFTGLRFSDAAKLKWDDVYSDHIEVVTQKTSEPLTIELNKYSKSIIERCAKRNKFFASKLVLPVISIQKSNEHLKDCAMLAQIDKPIRLISYRGSAREEKVVLKWEILTTHCARRTFVVNALRLGIPAEVIMKWTGHSDFKAMRPYVAIVDELKKTNMSKFDRV